MYAPTNSGCCVVATPARRLSSETNRVTPTSDLDYHLPEELVATRPAPTRDGARLMILQRGRPDVLEHRLVRDIPDLLEPGDLLAMNTSRVLPARLHGVRAETGGRVQGLFLMQGQQRGQWIVMLRAGHLRAGITVDLHDTSDQPGGVEIRLIDRVEAEPGAWLVQVTDRHLPGGVPDLTTIERVGLPPLPPYILSARRHRGEAEDQPDDIHRYQTVYAHAGHDQMPPTEEGGRSAAACGVLGSIAAPTAGLHFTPELLAQLDARRINRTEVNLHVGTGTFKPVETAHVDEHPIHAEWCSIEPSFIDPMQEAAARGRLFAIGTTSARTLESYAAWMAQHPGSPPPPSLETRILITPGHRWGLVGGMLTNFHLPRSSLMAMVASLLSPPGDPGAGVKHLRHAYQTAVAQQYRFYSYGDAMLILP